MYSQTFHIFRRIVKAHFSPVRIEPLARTGCINTYLERSADQHGHLILQTTIPTLNYFKGQCSLLLQYEILEKLVTFIYQVKEERAKRKGQQIFSEKWKNFLKSTLRVPVARLGWEIVHCFSLAIGYIPGPKNLWICEV